MTSSTQFFSSLLSFHCDPSAQKASAVCTPWKAITQMHAHPSLVLSKSYQTEENIWCHQNLLNNTKVTSFRLSLTFCSLSVHESACQPCISVHCQISVLLCGVFFVRFSIFRHENRSTLKCTYLSLFISSVWAFAFSFAVHCRTYSLVYTSYYFSICDCNGSTHDAIKTPSAESLNTMTNVIHGAVMYTR